MPGALSSFLGRVEELAELAELLERFRLITLTGAPGVGKTRLAREVAERHSDPAVLVELAPISDPALVHRALASALSVSEVPAQSLAETVIAHLRERRLLLVLDNCEHLIGGCAELVDSLLGGCPELSILATSREGLALEGERVWQVPPLAVPDPDEAALPEALMSYPAVCLFVERAGAVQSGFVLNSYIAPAVAEICRRLDGIPLAIELAAARVEILTPAEVARRLDDRFALLSKRSHGVLLRHQTLLAALDWSHELLSVAERALLRRLSVFVGGFCLEATETICAGADVETSEVFGILARLVSKSLVIADTANSRGRYRLLETIRAYGSDRLGEAGEAAALREVHAGFYLALAERAEPELTGPDQERWLERLQGERENLRLALEWSLTHGQADWALRLAGALVLFWRMRCYFGEGRELLDAVLSASDRAAPDLRAKALWGAGFLAQMTGDSDAAVPALEQSLQGFRELGDLGGSARALLILGNCQQSRGDPSALSLLEESAVLARETGDLWCLGHALGVAGFEYAGAQGDLPAARPLFEECLGVAREAQDKQGRRFGLIGLGSVAVDQGDYGLAESLLEEALAVTDKLGEDYSKAEALQYLGELALGRGDYGRARELVGEGSALIEEVGPRGAVVGQLGLRGRVAHADGDGRGARRFFQEAFARADTGLPTRVLLWMGELTVDEGNLIAGCRLVEDALDQARTIGQNLLTAEALHALGQLARGEGNLTRAAALHNEALELQGRIGAAPAIAASLEAVAGLAAAAGRHHHAARLFGASQALRDRHGYARPPWEASRCRKDVGLIHQALSAEELEGAWAQGAGLSIEEAVAQASKGRGRRGRSATGWPSLTKSEQRVAGLVAEGMTNPEIAERLFITVGTVKSHLSHIFSKLGISGRKDLAREVQRHRQPPYAGDLDSLPDARCGT